MPLGRDVFVARLDVQRVVLVAAALTIALSTVLLTTIWGCLEAAGTVTTRNALTTAAPDDSGLVVRPRDDRRLVVVAADAALAAG